MTNEWMNDPSLQEIAPYKLQFLQALIFESASLSREQMMPFSHGSHEAWKRKEHQLYGPGIPVHCQCS